MKNNNKMKKQLLFLLVNLLNSAILFSQISQQGTPLSFKNNLKNNTNIPTISLEPQDKRPFIQEDIERDKDKNQIWRFGINVPVNINIKEKAIVDNVENGKLYRLRIYSKDAISLNFRLSKYILPKGANLFIYNDTQDQILGAFTSENNKKTQILGISLLFTNAITIEYFEPNNAEFKGELEIDRVTHGYRNAYEYTSNKAFGSSGTCNNDVVCPEAAPYNYEINSVAMLVTGGNGFCSGALVNNTAQDETPYLLTANHCYSDPADWVFWFNWHRTECQAGTASTHNDVSGATLKARNADSDFCLVELSETPPINYNVFYAGWDRRDTPSTSSVGIHHPSGDVKKISWDNQPTTSTDYEPNAYLENSHWKISNWEDGTTEGGSSGSPLFNQDHRIIGQLHGGWAACGNTSPDYYGKFSMSWDRGGTSTNQLKNWLDPQNNNPEFIDGFAPIMPNLDLQLVNILSPLPIYCDEEDIIPTVKIKNLGSNTITSCTISYFIDDFDTITQNTTINLATFRDTTINLTNLNLTFGNHTFTAFVSYPNGILDTINENDTIKTSINVQQIGTQTFPIYEDFENLPFPQSQWEIVNSDNSKTWERNTTATGNTGSTACAYINFASYQTTGATDYLLTPWFQMPENGTITMTFKVAYRRYSSTWFDGLKVLITNDCESSWAELYSKFGTDLATGPDKTTEFTPSLPTDWRTDTIDLSAYYNQKIRIKFQSQNGYGNNLFIDDINLNYITEIGENNSGNIKIFPNPTKNTIKIIGIEHCQIEIVNLLGKVISKIEANNNQEINLSENIAGTYILRIITENNTIIKKLIKL